MDIYIKPKHKKTILVHRAVAETFIPNPYGKNTVNHKDGNKLNPCYYNLEWSTYSENNTHALKNDLRRPLGCEKHQNATLTNEQVNEICKLLEDGKIYSDIVKILKIDHIPNIKNKIKMIKTGNAWNEISKNYKIPKSRNKKKMYSDSLIHDICKLFSEGLNRQHVLIYLNLDNAEKNKKLLYSIYTRKKYKYISNKYKW